MLSKIDNNRFADLFFIFPEKDAVLSNNIEVKGWSKRPPDRHLWLFVHPKGGSDWMPQADEVLLEPDGKWKHVIFLGKEEESKAVFEIRAVWVDLEAHRELETYFKALCRKADKRYPDGCPGIRECMLRGFAVINAMLTSKGDSNYVLS
ncbi:MAG: hypothetical protein AUJ04_03375 [Acidobacteria bacterium 13_1_40CM_3_55_6]|nr:MAG: hypothetical protein AUJ04_03375 [Acidobacteria bacterium 13_1_40CM_3_55_6]